MTARSLFTIVFGMAAAIGLGSSASASTICPSTANTNSDCGYIITISAAGTVTGAPVPNALPYDGSDDALVGVVNNSSAVYNGSITLTGTGNGGSIFGFDGDGICAYTQDPYCSMAATGYEGPLNTFASYSGNKGAVVFSGLGAGQTTFFSLEGAPSSLSITVNPEPGSMMLLAGGLSALALLVAKKRQA